MSSRLLPSFTPPPSSEQNKCVTAAATEFDYLPAQAEALGAEAPPVRRRTLPLADGRSLSALQFGNTEPEVTLLHGAGLNAHTWDTTVLALSAPTLVIDLPGHGDSSWREDADYSARTLAPDIATGLREWTTRPQVLVGHSLGGLTAAAVASAHPELVRSVIVVDITPGIDASGGPAALRAFYAGPTDFATRDELVDRAMSLGLGGDRAATERGVFLNTRVRPDGRIEWKHHFAHLAAAALAAPESETAASGAASRALLDASGWEDLAGVAAPLTLVRATRGFVTLQDAERFQQHLSAARIVEIDASHNVQETAPAELAALIHSTIPSSDG